MKSTNTSMDTSQKKSNTNTDMNISQKSSDEYEYVLEDISEYIEKTSKDDLEDNYYKEV